MMIEKKKSLSQILIFAALLIIAISTIYPMVFMLLCSFKERIEYLTNIFGLPKSLYLKNYRMSFDKFNILRLSFNSMVVTLSSIAATTLITSMAAFGFAKLKFKGSGTVFTLVIACMMIP